MEKSFAAIYKNGIFEPLNKINLKEKQKIILKILPPESIVLKTKGMINGNAAYLKSIAESEELLEWNL